MHITQDLKLLRLIKIIPPIIVVTFAVWVNFIVINDNKIKLKSEISTFQKNFIDTEKETIKAQVNQLYQEINYEKSSTETILKKDIKERVYEAHSIATTIYQQNKNLSEKEVTKLITDALRSIRFNQGRGYYFIYKIKGTNVMHPVVPAIEGTSQSDFQDVRGNYIVRDMGQIIKKSEEGFHRWWFVKPQNKSQEFEKIGFGKYFAPYDWFIGTGEYVIDVESDIKARLLRRINNIRYGKNGYFFVIDYQGNILSDYSKKHVGTNRIEIRNQHGISTVEEIIKIAKHSEDFLYYESPLMPSTGQPAEKVSFIKGLPDWKWAIGTGAYISEIESYLAEREEYIGQQNESEFLKILCLSLFVTLFFVTLSFMLSNYLARRFSLYESRINKNFSELNTIKEQLQHQALHDVLTNLPNRVLLADRLSQSMVQSQRHHNLLAVVFLDLDGFKHVNDTYGHDFGDELLIIASLRMKEALRESDSLARIGGDEFVAVLTDLTTVEDCKPVLERLLLAASEPVKVGKVELKISASIGVTLYPQDKVSADQLMRHADQAMYVAKESGKNRYHLFNTAEDDAVKIQRESLEDIRTALDDNQFVLYYQPKVNMRKGSVIGAEALIRWQHPKRGLLNPLEFLPVIENHPMMIELGEWVIDSALTQISQWQAMGLNLPLNTSVNIAAVQLQQANFVDRLTTLLATHPDVDPRNLELEVLETSALEDLQHISTIMNASIALGVNFALDDFGTGYSSLTHLRRLPANLIKIDQTFVRDMLIDTDDLAIVEGVIALAKSFKRDVIAEGVETIEHGTVLLQLGCELAQGYGIARPMPASDIPTWISDWKPNVSWQLLTCSD
jgi:diguanylate cyclase (GGDEF)-like protein